MQRFIERGFFAIVQKISLTFAIVAFIAVIVFAYISYENIMAEANDEIEPPIIKLADYQNPISAENDSPEAQKIQKSLTENNQDNSKFDQAFEQSVDQIVKNLSQLPDEVINKDGIEQKIKILIKIKTNPYKQDLQLSYAQSLAKLTRQLVNVGGDKTNIDDFIRWHDKEFAFQVEQQTQANLAEMNNLQNQRATGYMTLGMAFALLGIFIMFVMMLVMFRIEQNTRR